MSKEELPGSKRSMYGYILTYPCYKEGLQTLRHRQQDIPVERARDAQGLYRYSVYVQFVYLQCICVVQLVNRYFEPSQPQTITSEPETNFSLSPRYSAHWSSKHTFSKIGKISPGTNFLKQNIHIYTKHKIFEDFVPSALFFFLKSTKVQDTLVSRTTPSIYRHQI